MKIDFDSAVWVFIFVCGCVFCWLGIRAKNVETKKQAGILSILLGICFLVVCILGLFEHFLKANHSPTKIISIVQLIVAGMMLGIYLVMWILGHWKLLKKSRKTFNEDSQTGDLK
jgi:cytochrome bd-type quinol oxidase subunit 1